MSMSSCQVFSAPASCIAECAPAAAGESSEPAAPKVPRAGTDGAVTGATAHETTVRPRWRPLGNVCTTCLIPEPLHIRPTEPPAGLW
eukprot:CAMPEP_0179426774 /NCGR_PEP_ID=MMETSP0799-20121207/12945_1 /TAXON_ID=46947 /ORGANISM="Geminigera cryophila, Strain CCMP2564" /LENGTH=86 /DNA_ID=CAMNT_0021201603 /DNA_START=1208 /DNA_END=1468 /DNA_ORIENTATION=+